MQPRRLHPPSEERQEVPSSVAERNPDRLPLSACTKCIKGLEETFVRRFLTSREVPASGSIPKRMKAEVHPRCQRAPLALPSRFAPLAPKPEVFLPGGSILSPEVQPLVASQRGW